MRGRKTGRQMAKELFILHILVPNFFQYVANGFDWDEKDQLRASILGMMNGWFIIGDAISWGVTAAFAKYSGENMYATAIRNPTNAWTMVMNEVVNFTADFASGKDYISLQDLDINATPAIKGNDSVLDGIDLMKSVKIISYSCNEDLHKEWQSYRWKTNSDEKVITDSRGRPSPVKVQDDLLCALRYAIYSHFNKPVVKMAFI
jgi:hypothetical protein